MAVKKKKSPELNNVQSNQEKVSRPKRLSTKEEIIEKVKLIRAKIVNYDTGEKWVDDQGNLYNISRNPVDYKRVAENERSPIIK